MEKKISLKTNARDINSLIQILLKKFADTGRDSVSYNELKKEIDLDDIGSQIIAEELRFNLKIHYDEIRKVFSLKKKYHFKNKEELLEYLLTQPQGKDFLLGLEINYDLQESYKNIQKDIEILKASNQIRCIETKNPGKKTIIFARDPRYDCLDFGNIDSLKQQFLQNLNKIEDGFPQKMIQLDDQVKKEKTKQQKRKLKQYQIFNEQILLLRWMKDKINFTEVIQAKEEEYKQYINSKKKIQVQKQQGSKLYRSKFIQKK